MAELNDTDLPEAESGDRPFRKRILLAVKIAISLVLVYVILNKVQLAEIHADFQDIQWAPFAIGMLLTVPNLLIQHYKWRYLVRIVDPRVSDKEIFAALMCGFSIGLVTPGRMGEIGRGIFIRSDRKSEMTGMAIIDKILSQWALSVCGLAALFYILEYSFDFTLAAKTAFVFMAAVFVVSLLLIIFFPQNLRALIRYSKKLFHYAPYRHRIIALIEASEDFKRHHFLPGFCFSIVFQWIIFLQLYFFVNAFDRIDAWNGLIAAAAAMFVKSLLPIAVMDLGVREGAAIFFLTGFGVPAASAFDASIMLFLSNVLLPGAAGIYYFTRFNFLKE